MLDPTGQYHQFRPHPWHGLSVGPDAPSIVNAYIEITPFDLVKYEVDKQSGYLRVDRPQRTSAQPPTLYGFIPRTYCGDEVKALSPASTKGDGDPLDICVLSERPIARAEIVLSAKIVGGLQMIDGTEADDKIVAVLKNDYVWGDVNEIDDLPHVLIERLEHYFRTYKLVPGTPPRVSIESRYNSEHALRVIAASMRDYDAKFPDSLILT
ncbi:MAG: inorganic pyrophosphatase [bacterium]|nr:inorganic pyrophosphatase [Candidatus Kapabacteria bacterium]